MSYENVLVVGLGISGKSAAALLLKNGKNVVGIDDNIQAIRSSKEIKELEKQGLITRAPQNLKQLPNIDLVVVSPGVSQDHPLLKAAKKASIEIIGEIELACRFVKQKIFGITGTNGKTTVTMMVSHVLNACGIPACIAGNIGEPLSAQILKHPDKILVTELSSYQLDTLSTRALDAAVLLNISPDHLDRYNSYEDYVHSKFHIQQCIKEKGSFYINKDSASEWRKFLLGPFLAFNGEGKENIEYILPVRYRRSGGYEWENRSAAFSLCYEAGVSPQQFEKELENFKKAPHRLEFVREINGVAFINDSKATNAEAVVRAVESMQGKVILIAGGQDKGLSYKSWPEVFQGKVRCVCAIGETASKIAQELDKVSEVKIFESLNKAINFASSISKAGETVLLSPGCSSFDMFKDYEQRGEKFKQAVHQLQR
ncbi:MAG: UDP-N-acetylmuramoylalanine--D-glutamate ligase [Chlamydiales bacterium]|jgi:UDP-N-acetylmuramoylalanine--D-glutamate ligase